MGVFLPMFCKKVDTPLTIGFFSGNATLGWNLSINPRSLLAIRVRVANFSKLNMFMLSISVSIRKSDRRETETITLSLSVTRRNNF